MNICPNCSHPNPDSATQCEACYTELPLMVAPTVTAGHHCPQCGAGVHPDATFCGQCGYSLTPSVPPVAVETSLPPTVIAGSSVSTPIPDPLPPTVVANPTPIPDPLPPTIVANPTPVPDPVVTIPPVSIPDPIVPPVTPVINSTQLQSVGYKLLHVQTNTTLELPQNLTVIHIGKPNDQIPPDIDVSGFACSEVVSRVHADLRIDGDACYIEDAGSANGTYINHTALLKGNRHRLRTGDRISLGKGDLVTFIFQES